MSDRDNKTPEVGLMSDKDGGVFDRTEWYKRNDMHSNTNTSLSRIVELLEENNKLLRKILK